MKILVTGGTGLVGNAINEICDQYNYKFIFLSSTDGDLSIMNNVNNIFKKEQPDIVIHLAAQGYIETLMSIPIIFGDENDENDNTDEDSDY